MRLVGIASGDHGVGFVLVHLMLALVSLVTCVVALRELAGDRTASSAASPTSSVAATMGQPITVVEKPSSNPAVLRFETNRPLSGMGHERYTEPPWELLDKTGDELARRLFAAGGVEAVHINGSVVTVTLAGGRTGEGLGRRRPRPVPPLRRRRRAGRAAAEAAAEAVRPRRTRRPESEEPSRRRGLTVGAGAGGDGRSVA